MIRMPNRTFRAMEVSMVLGGTTEMILIVRGHINTKEPKYENYLWRMFGSGSAKHFGRDAWG
jgi:hypothetical protein